MSFFLASAHFLGLNGWPEGGSVAGRQPLAHRDEDDRLLMVRSSARRVPLAAPSGRAACAKGGLPAEDTMKPLLAVQLAALMLAALAGAAPASARSPTAIQCCHAAVCRLKTTGACQKSGGIDMGPGTCNPNPCGGATTTTSTTTTSSTTTTMPTGPCQCGTPDPTRLQFTTAIGSGNCGVSTKSD